MIFGTVGVVDVLDGIELDSFAINGADFLPLIL